MIRRAQHWTEIRESATVRRRVISNWSNLRRPGRTWEPTADADPDLASGRPDDWVGSFDFRYARELAPLQFYAGDTSDPDNTAMVGLRPASSPGAWVNFKAIDTVPGVQPQALAAQRAIGWAGLWQNCDLAWASHPSRLAKRIRITQAPHPTAWRFSMRLAPGMTYTIANDRLTLRDSEGAVVMRSRRPHVEDAAGNAWRAYLDEAAPVGGDPVLRLWINPADMGGAVYPLVVDPPVEIAGPPDVEDLWLRATFADRNYGNGTILRVVPSSDTVMIRLVGSAIPSGSVSSLRLWLKTNTNFLGQTQHRTADANTWVEGNSFGVIEAGAGCWNYAKYATQAWAGSAGCNTSGTDYDASPSFAIQFLTAGLWGDLEASWAEGWRDNPGTDNGLRLSATFGGGDYKTTEDASSANWPRFEVTAQGGAPERTYPRGFGRGFDRGMA